MEADKMRSKEPKDNKTGNSMDIQEKIKKLLQNPPKYVFSEAGKKEIMDRIYELEPAK